VPDFPGRRRHDAESPELTSDWTWPKCIAGGRHEFTGFGEAYRQPPDGYAQRVVPGLPAAWSQRNATFAPLKPSGRKQWSGGVRGEDGYLTQLSLHRGHGAVVVEPVEPSVPSRYLDRAWFGGYLFGHFGHFILESVTRLLSPEIAACEDPIVFLPIREHIRVSPKQARVLQHLRIAPERIVFANAPLAVGELRGHDPAYELTGSVHPAAYRCVQASDTTSAAGNVLWLSRIRHTGRNNKRVAHGEDALEARLQRELGVEIVYPEELPFEQQVAKFAQARAVVGCEGSAFYTAMFLRAAPHLIKLCSSYVPLDLILADEVSDGNSTYVFVNRAPFSPSLDRAASWHIDVDRAFAAIARTIGD
jgi:hypothetical protein